MNEKILKIFQESLYLTFENILKITYFGFYIRTVRLGKIFSSTAGIRLQ